MGSHQAVTLSHCSPSVIPVPASPSLIAMFERSPVPGSSRSISWKRPPLISELADEAMKTMVPWNDTHEYQNLKAYLRHAEGYRRTGLDLAKSGDIEAAFVKLAQAATLIVERIPTHSHYATFLSSTQRHNLSLVSRFLKCNKGCLYRSF